MEYLEKKDLTVKENYFIFIKEIAFVQSFIKILQKEPVAEEPVN